MKTVRFWDWFFSWL